MKMFRKDEGFTLVELMVVVLIIGILVAIAIPVFNAAQANAKLKTCQGNQRIVEGAIQTWRSADSANAPVAFAGLNVNAGTAAGTALIGPYLKSAPQCPAAAAGANLYHLDAAGTTVDGDQSAGTWVNAALGGVAHAHF